MCEAICWYFRKVPIADSQVERVDENLVQLPLPALVVNRRSGEEFARPHCDAFVLRVAIDVQAKFLGPYMWQATQKQPTAARVAIARNNQSCHIHNLRFISTIQLVFKYHAVVMQCWQMYFFMFLYKIVLVCV